MVYITTTKFLGSLSVMSNLQDGDVSSVLVFYKENETVKMSEIAGLVSNNSVNVELVEVFDRDDMLILLGGWFVNHDDTVTLLDSTIPVPKRYADRVKTNVAVSKATRTRRKTSAKKEKDATVEKDQAGFDKGADLIAGKAGDTKTDVSTDVMAKVTSFDNADAKATKAEPKKETEAELKNV